MNIRFSAKDEAFRREIADWLAENLGGEFAPLRGRGGPGDEHALQDERRAWERHLGEAGWTCVGWPKEYGGRDLSLSQQVIFYEEYARAGGPGRVPEGWFEPWILAWQLMQLRPMRRASRAASGKAPAWFPAVRRWVGWPICA